MALSPLCPLLQFHREHGEDSVRGHGQIRLQASREEEKTGALEEARGGGAGASRGGGVGEEELRQAESTAAGRSGSCAGSDAAPGLDGPRRAPQAYLVFCFF